MKKEKPAHIPKELLVGYQYRYDTVNGKLAFATAESITGKVYSENQFYHWCDGAIDMDKFQNTLMGGFFLNKSRGGYSAYGSSALRVLHPLGFEFEIDIANVSYILQHSNINMSEITSKCILGWVTGKLVLIPENSPLFEQSNSMVSGELKKVGTKVIVGKKYITKNAQKCIYLGEQDYYLNNSRNLSSKERAALHLEYEQDFQIMSDGDTNKNNYPYWFVVKSPLKQHLCYDIESNKFFNTVKSALKLEIPEDPISQEDIEALLEDFEKTDNGSRTISTIESHPEYIFKWIKIAHSEYFSGYYESHRHILLGLSEDNQTGSFISYHFKHYINFATKNDNEYFNSVRELNGETLRPKSTLPKISGYSENNQINYLIWFKMCQKGYVHEQGIENFDYSAIKDVLRYFNIFPQGTYKKTDNLEYFEFYPEKRGFKEIEIFDLDALDVFLDGCVEALKGKVATMEDIRKESNVPIIMNLYENFFEQEKEKMLERIEKHFKVIALRKEKNDYYKVLNGKE